ncbi:MAG: HAMP domain-containing sensor histidine kinase, partial [Spirochaetales bacterium]|nr:HAMP domain-containing sensor histidine kinase [Spirochaetales bacterium]
GYELEWIDMDRDEYRELMEENRRMKYPFSPLQVLAGIPHGAHIKLMISLPSSLDYRYPDGPPPDEKEGLFIDGSPFHFSGRVLMVGFENAPYYHEMEKRTVLVWLLSQLILYGTVLVFMVLSLQLRKTRELRNREKEFVASMTHELRTPLTVIQSAADNLSRGIVPPENISRYGEVMKDQSSRLSGMIEEILMFSSLEGRTGSPGRAVPMDLPDLLNELKEGMEALAREKQTLLHWNSDGIPDKLRGYPDEIRLILSNLIVNALHHGISPGDEGIKITVRCLVSGRLKISVEDSGPGIPPKEQKKIFSPFYRSRSTREQQTRGSGLGLFIAMKKSRMIGGKLTLESPYRRLDGRKIQGCRFTLETPCEFPENSDSGDKN